MFNTKSILTNTAFTAAAATVTVLAVSPAEAFSLRAGSTLSLTGSGIVQGEGEGNPPSSATLKFLTSPTRDVDSILGQQAILRRFFRESQLHSIPIPNTLALITLIPSPICY